MAAVELRLYDMHSGAEVLRLSEFVSLRFEETLVGGPDLLNATISQGHYAKLPKSGFAPARIFVLVDDEWECWWGGVIEEMNPETPDVSACQLVGQGWRRLLAYVGDHALDLEPDLLPTYDVLSGTAYPHAGVVGTGAWAEADLLLLAQASADYTPSAVYTTTQHGYYAHLIAAADADINASGSATNPPGKLVRGALDRMADDLVDAAQQQDRPLLWWFEPGGALRMGVLPAATAHTLVADTDLLEPDVRRDTAEVVNSVQARFGAHTYPEVRQELLQPPGPCPNYAPNAAMAEWRDMVAGADANCPDTGALFRRDAWRCTGWVAGLSPPAELDWYEITQGHRLPTDGAGNLAYPRGYGLTSLRVAARRKTGATAPIVVQVETAFSERVGVTMMAYDMRETSEGLTYQIDAIRETTLRSSPYPMRRRRLTARELEAVKADAPEPEKLGVTADGRIDLTKAAIAGGTMSNVQFWLHGYALPTGVTVQYRWTWRTFASGTTVAQAAATGPWQNVASGELRPADTYCWTQLGATMLGGGARHLHLRWECKFPAGVTNAEVQICGVKVEHGVGSATAPGDFQVGSDIQVWRNVEDADVGATGPAANSIADYGLRHAAINLPLPREITAATALLSRVAGYLRTHAVPRWQVAGWHPRTRRFRPQDGYVRVVGDADWCGQAYVLERTVYRLDDSGMLLPELHLGSPMRHRLPTEMVDPGDEYIPPSVLEGTFRLPRYTH